MEEWKEYKLEEICMKITDGSHSSPRAQEYGYPMFSVKDMLEYGFDYSKCKYISKEDFLILKQNGCVPQKGDVLVAKDGSYLKQIFVCKQTKEEGILSSIAIFRPNELVDSYFLCYLLKSPQVYNYIANHCVSGSALPRIVLKDFKSVKLQIPSKETQINIVSKLKSLDDKIECNRRINDNFAFSFLLLSCFVLWLLKLINDNLEQQAQALFKSWFVDFEPFMDGEFVESEMGKTPKDLSVKRVSEIPHTIETGRRPKGGVGEISSGVPSVGAEHVKGLGNYDYSKTKYITEEYASSLKTGKVNGYELLIYKDGGKPGYFIPNYSIFGEGYPFEECFLNEHVFKLDFGDKGYNAFCYFYFWTDYVMNYLNAQGGKAAIPGINRQDIENIQIYAPENELVKRFGDIVLPSIRQILFNCKESRRLAQLRDTLLPRLMSGELKVNEIEMH